MSEHGKNLASQVKGAMLACHLADFTVEGPKFKTDGDSELEAGDMFLVWRDCLIAFQIKSRLIKDLTEENEKQECARISKRAKRAVNQVKTFKRAQKMGALNLCENLRGVKIPFLEREFKKYFGVVVVGAEVQNCIDSKDCEIQIIGGIDEVQSIPVHIFSISDFKALLSEINTLPDLIKYLETRQILFRSGQLIQPVSEKDFVVVYQTNYPVIDDLLKNPKNTALIEKDTWKGIVKNNFEALKKREEDMEFSKVIDYIIEEVHTSIGFNLGDEMGDSNEYKLNAGNMENYLFVAEELASIPRVVRAHIGKKIVEKCKASTTSEKGFSYFSFLLEDSDIPTVFLAHRGTREERYIRLTDLVSCAYVHFKLEKAFGIAMSAFGQGEYSYDFLYVEKGKYENQNEIEERAKLVFGPTKKIDYGKW